MIADDAGLLPGMILGKYQIVQRLGSGGMGSVYEAVHRDISKPVALKTLAARLASEPQAQARFLREAASASRLTHPHVVDVTDFGSDGGITYLVMELLRGEDLAAALVREPMGLPVERLTDIMLAVCAGVFAAHEVGVIHRDLKPPNIFLSHGSLDDIVPKVLDFGISKMLDEKMSSTLTGTGTVIGTTPYLSPEQVAGRPVDARSDQYSLGVILYECATGRRPHEGENLFAIMRSIADGRFRRPRDLRPDMPPAFEAVVLRAMSHDPARRFESVHAVGHALLPFASPRRQVLWGEYFGTGRVSRNQALPRTEPLPELGHGIPSAEMEPLDSTRTGDRQRRYEPGQPDFGFVSEPAPQLSRGSRAPLVIGVVLLLMLAGGGGAYWMLSQPPPVVRSVGVEQPRPPMPPPPPPVEPTVEPAPVTKLPVVERTPPVAAQPEPTPTPKSPTPQNPHGKGKKPKVKGAAPRVETDSSKPTKPPILPAPILD
jgi:eukaryotic-like serine/threonine-protein kinase